MPEQFEVAELVKIGVEDERSGVAFYSRLADNVEDSGLRKTFADLAEQEKFHQKRFQDMLDRLGGVKTPEEYPGQYMAYLSALTSGRAFPDPSAAERAAEKCESDAKAVELASRYERDTLMLMNEIRPLVPEKDRATVDELIREEQTHLVTLSEARRKVGTDTQQ
ncbi:MAG: ferritin family protein [Planctomycetota bacterium]